MAEREEKEMGLQRDVSSIFEGVRIPRSSGAKLPGSSPTQHSTGDVPAEPASSDHQNARIPQVPLIQKLNQPAQLLQKDTPAKQPKVEPASRAIGLGYWQRMKDKLFVAKPGVSMARRKASVILVPVLSIALIFVLRQVFGTPPTMMKAAIEDIAPSVTVAADSDDEVDWEIPAPYPATLRDPMRLNVVMADQAGTGQPDTRTMVKPDIKGILYSEDNPAAVVGERIVHEGDRVSGAIVVKIDRDRIEFEMGGRRWQQRLQE